MCAGRSLLLLAIPLLSANTGSADVIPTSPFTGTTSESWESFATTFGNEQLFLPDPTVIMGGQATVSHPQMDVYQSSGTFFLVGLGTSGFALTADGIKGMTIGGLSQTAVIVFDIPVSQFGAYWAAYTDPPFASDPAVYDISFFDESSALIGTQQFTYTRSQQHDGLLEWHGWSSTVPIKRVSYTSNYPTVDGLQADPVPEPAALAPLSFAALTLRRKRSGTDRLSASSRRH